MRKIVALLFTVVLSTTLINAKPVDHETVCRVAANWLGTTEATTIVYTHTDARTGIVAFYAVNVGNHSFVLVSADDVAKPVLGYSTARSFRSENIPSNILWFYNDLAAQIGAAVSDGLEPDEEIASQWTQLVAERQTNTLLTTQADSVGPLLTTIWSQDYGYNELCPVDIDGPYGHAVTGCVATAMAQIIKYWEYPTRGRGTHSYHHPVYGTLSANYENTIYDYAHMPSYLDDDNTPQQINAVATLMRDCGVALNMDYGPDLSDGSELNALLGLVNFFKYSPNIEQFLKSNYNNSLWDSLLRDNISNGCPILYCCWDNIAGHAFVCDGYTQNGHFHFNWGWGGYDDGWYLSSAVTGFLDYDANGNQSALLGILPDSNSSVIFKGLKGLSTFYADNPIEYKNSYYGYEQDTVVFKPDDDSTQLVIEYIPSTSWSETSFNASVYDGIGTNNLLGTFSGQNTNNPPIVSHSNALTLVFNGHFYYGGHLLISKRTCLPITGSDNITACNSYSWEGSVYTDNTTLIDTLSTAIGCDSIVTHHLTINHSVPTSSTVTACDSYNWNGTAYTNSGNFIYSHPDGNGCPQVDTLHLTINHSSNTTETATACDSYTWRGTTYTVSGTQTYQTTNAAGCDSTATLSLTIHHAINNSFTEQSCGNYTWNGTTYNNSGNYIYSHPDTNGCTQVDTLHLSIINVIVLDTSAVACESYTWHGTTHTESGDYLWTKAASAPGVCDSTTTLHLTIHHAANNSLTEQHCDSYTWHGTSYSNSGVYTYSYNDANGCTQVDTLHLSIINVIALDTSVVACENYTWHGTTYTENGDYIWTQTSSTTGVCDTTTTLHLTVNDNIEIDTFITACDSYTWHGTTYTEGGGYVWTGTSSLAGGCDTTVYIHLTINQTTYFSGTVFACDSIEWNGETYTSSCWAPPFVTTNMAGCDSIVSDVFLRVRTTLVMEKTFANYCDSLTYNIDDTILHFYESGVYTYEGEPYDTLQWCKTIYLINVTINHSVRIYDTLRLDYSDLPYDYHGNTLYGFNDYLFQSRNVNGCDSIVYVHVELANVDISPVLASDYISLYPNPTDRLLTVEGRNILSVEVIDAMGRKMMEQQCQDSDKALIDLSSLPRGTYTLRVTTTDGVAIKRVVKGK